MDSLTLRTHGFRSGTYVPASDEIILIFHGVENRDIALQMPSPAWIDLCAALVRLAAKIGAGVTAQ